jgi:hypothetical protein
MSDSMSYSSNESESMREKITKIYSRQGTASKMFRDTSAISGFSPVDFSKIGKYTSLGQIFNSKHNNMRICKYNTRFRALRKYMLHKIRNQQG